MNGIDQARPDSNDAYAAADAHADCQAALDLLWTIERRHPDAKSELRGLCRKIQRLQNWVSWVAAGDE